MKGIQSAQTIRSMALCLFAAFCANAWAIEPPANGSGSAPQPSGGAAKAAGCSPASQIAQLAFNNVRAVLENGGNKWTRRGASNPGYEVPITEDFTGPNAIYAGALWMGGVSPDNQLKIAAVLYRTRGNDFWPGPLTNTGDASVTPEVCDQYDQFWTTSRQQVEAHIQWRLCSQDPECNVDEIFPEGYSIPTAFLTWPAEGNVEAGQDLHLAPWVDWDNGDGGNGIYNPAEGDHPDYGFDLTVEDCLFKDREDPVPLFGDNNIYWIFNDKGNVHQETSGGQPIGLEVRAQAFSFNANNEINNMTFYNYVVINQGTQTLLNTYFGIFVDPDLGCPDDDFAGCDVQRGLGFVYNWSDVDASCTGGVGYGGPSPPPPAIGVDFFEGPFQDADGVDNPGPEQMLSCQEYQQQLGIPYKGIGIGYGDGVVDNERFGMRAYIYFNRESTNQNMTDPDIGGHFYNYLQSVWKDNTPQTYGGNGYSTEVTATPAFYMFPWASDPVGWGTNCVPQQPWQETEPTPAQPDRRFVQSAGPFTLEPGAYNNITVGVVWARASSGSNTASVELMRLADDKAQALFDNCFKILDGPDAPDLSIRELDRELILFLENPSGSNNEGEAYLELDPVIPEESVEGEPYDRYYRFQGYKVYQLRNSTVSVSDIDDPELARLIYQGDVEDGVGQIVNFELDPDIELTVPREMVNGADQGVTHAIRVTQDAFAQGDPQLVNFKSYYFLAIAYGYNNYEDFNIGTGEGQAFRYVAGRKGAFGAIRAFVGIPHKPAPENGGTIQNSQFGDRMAVTRLEGQGSGNNVLELDQTTVNAIVSSYPWRKDQITYVPGRSPIDVKIIDPLAVPDAQFEVYFLDTATADSLDDAYWKIVRLGDEPAEVFSHRAIDFQYEQLLLEWGFSVTVGQVFYTGTTNLRFTNPVGTGIIEFADPSKPWLTGIPDAEGVNPQNWIRSGTYTGTADEAPYNDRLGRDDEQIYEGILGGTWAPWALVGGAEFQPGNSTQASWSQGVSSTNTTVIAETPSIQLVITSDKSKWTRSVVLEQEAVPGLAQDGAQKLNKRNSPSVDKEGRRVGEPGVNAAEATLNDQQPTGAGWFPGYAIDVASGERLNISFGENSFWGGEIGRDLRWNPNDVLFTDANSPFFGGSHWIYIWKNQRRVGSNPDVVPMYDESQFIYNTLESGSVNELRGMWRSMGWVGSAMVAPGRTFMETDVKILLSVEKPFEPYREWPGSTVPAPDISRNNGLPLYTFGTGEYATEYGVASVAESALDIINIVPNPYYAFSGYETSRLDNRVKFINLPPTCTISIFSVSGTLVRKFRKDNDLTYLDWDLRNMQNIPIAGGAYICHIEVPDVGEKVLKWFGVMRPMDLQNF